MTAEVSTAPSASAPALERVELRIGGMTCGACAGRVERKLNKVDGVSASVNYATEIATIDAPRTLTVADLQAVVDGAGYSALPRADDSDEVAASADGAHTRDLWRRLAVALVLFIPLSDLSIMFATVPSTRFAHWQWLLVVLAAPVVVYSAWPLHAAALRNARHGTSTMDTLVSTGIIVASGFSVYAMFFRSLPIPDGAGVLEAIRASGEIYLDTAAGITVFVLAGRYFEAKAKRRAFGALRSLAALTARDATVLTRAGGELRIPVRELKVGQQVLVRPGETIPTDATVRRGQGAVDRSAMTGEPLPVEVEVGGDVTGGTLLTSGHLVAEVTAVGGDTQLAGMVRLVEAAQADKASVQRLADRVSAVFVPVVFAIALTTAVVWTLVGGSVDSSLSAGLGVLVIACPCALGLATPTALMVASGRGAQLGIFLKGHQALEATRHVDTVVLDKTGTVTTGQMAVAELVVAGVETEELLALVGGLENASEHAVGRALTAAARAQLAVLPEVTDFEALVGLGAVGTVAGRHVLVGRPALFADRGLTVPAELAAHVVAQEARGRTVVLVAVDSVVCAVAALADTVKPTAAAAVARLHALGLRTMLLTGDNRAAAEQVAAQVGITDVVAGVLPGGKVTEIAKLKAAGLRVAMVGDGINDGPALATADLGLAIGTGTDVAIGAADIILVRDDLGSVPDAVELARATLRTIRGNIAWAFGYNVAAIPVAALGFLDPLLAGAAMAFSSLFVVSNSLRLRRFRPGA
ncbi:MAG: heavy metal translocating P-type ATPase [Mycobacteriaceae bacterium]